MVEYLKASIKLRLSTQNINKILKIEFNPTGPRLTSHIMLNMLTHSFRVHFERAHIVCWTKGKFKLIIFELTEI